MSQQSALLLLTVRELENTYGVLFVGYILTMMAYGFTFFQTYVYYSQYPLDHWVIKATVCSLCLLDTGNSALISHAIYHYLVTYYPETPPLLDATFTYCAEFGISVLAVLVVQIYYSHRVWMVSQNAAFGVGIAVVSLASFALGIAATGNFARNLVFASLTTPQAKGIIASSQGLTFLSGATVFAALSFYLSPSRNPMIKSTARLYNIAIGYTITRGFLATAVQFSYFVAFLSVPTKFTWMPFHLIASKVFINSFLAMLNVREIYQGQGVNEEDDISGITDTASLSSVPRLHSIIRFAAESKSNQVTHSNDNNAKMSLRDEQTDLKQAGN